jgi:hypothetical protein
MDQLHTNLADAIRNRTTRNLALSYKFEVDIMATIHEKPRNWQEAQAETWLL